MSNEINLKWELPDLNGNEDEVSEMLHNQLEYLVDTIKGVMSMYKEKGFKVPTLALRGGRKKTEAPNEYKETSRALYERVLAHMPNVSPLEQRIAIKKLIETGKSKDELLEMFEESVKDYPLTTWRTILYKINHQLKTESSSTEFQRAPLSEEDVQSVVERVKGYGTKTPN